jgi:uncharacterized damage-inducible protein DinB
MSEQTLMTSLFRFKAWANEELFGALTALRGEAPSPEYQAAIRVLNHAHTVDRIFVANLQKLDHAYRTNWPVDVPSLTQLSQAVRDTDRWYVDYISHISPNELEEVIDFTFTDATWGRMSREEMLAHVITHGGYHRGEVGRLLPQIESTASQDVFAGYLHRSDPKRREQLRSSPAASR